MKFGVLFKPMDPPNAERLPQRWREILEAARVIEESGFDGVFIPEHHMMPDGYPPSPWAALGALAAVTERIEIGTTIHLLPLEHPIHVAEHAAMADVIANGRVRLGVGMANFEPEFKLFGLEQRTQVSRFEEAIELVRRAWSGETISHHGKHFTIEAEGPITPLPIGAELWMGAMSDGGVRRAARLGAPWPTDPLHGLATMRHWTELYRATGEEHGTGERLGVHLLRDGWCADSMEEVERVWWPHLRIEHWFYFQNIPRWVAEFEPFLLELKDESDFRFESHRVDRLIVGTPDDCIASIERFRAELGIDYLIMCFRHTHGPSFEEELRCIRRFGRDVISAFR